VAPVERDPSKPVQFVEEVLLFPLAAFPVPGR
jgi:hypothetical protein